MRCANCYHARLDHAAGRCMNRTMRFEAAAGGTVASVCGCKRYADEIPAPAPAQVLASAVEPEPEPVQEEVAEPPPTRTPRTRRMGG